MVELLRNHITHRLGKDLDHLDKVLLSFRHICQKRNEQLLREGEVCKYVYFIAKGCLQVYVHDNNFNETTRDLVIEDHWCSELGELWNGFSVAGNRPIIIATAATGTTPAAL